MRRAHDRIVHFLWRVSQEKRTIQDRKTLKDTDHKSQAIEFGQVKNHAGFLELVDPIFTRLQMEFRFLVTGKLVVDTENHVDCISYDHSASPGSREAFDYGICAEAILHRKGEALFRFVGIGRQSKRKLEKVGHLGCKQLLEVGIRGVRARRVRISPAVYQMEGANHVLLLGCGGHPNVCLLLEMLFLSRRGEFAQQKFLHDSADHAFSRPDGEVSEY